jgi:hypothetical protein
VTLPVASLKSSTDIELANSTVRSSTQVSVAAGCSCRTAARATCRRGSGNLSLQVLALLGEIESK